MAQRKRFLKVYQTINGLGRGLFFILKLILGTIIFGIIAAATLFFVYTRDLPRPERFTDNEINQATKIYDRDGKVVLSSIYGEEKRTYLTIDKIPDVLQKAIISTEDARFYQHNGIDIRGIIRAIGVDLQSGEKKQGASTITQQLIRSSLLSNEKSIDRKLKEIILSLELDKKYPKDQILEWYINQVPFGINIYGAQEASLTYFDKPASELTLAQAALLAAVIQRPSYYNPYGYHLEELMARKDYALDRMAEEHYISQEEADEAKKEELAFDSLPKTLAPHFVTYVKQQLNEKYGQDFLETKGLKIYTTLDWDLQVAAQKDVKDGTEKNQAWGAYNGALIAIAPKTGEILAMVGSADPEGDPFPEGCDPATTCKFVPDFNVATQGNRQPGSSFKPFIYAEAFHKGFTDKSIVVDELTDFGVYGGKHYIPSNYDGLFRGAITLRNALAQSLNIPALKVLRDMAGLEDSIKLAKAMGITTLNEPASFYGLPLVLGAGDVKLLDMVAGYSTFANGGYYIPPAAILKIEDANGDLLYENDPTPKKVLEESVCSTIADVLSDNNARAPVFGYYSNLYFENYKVSVKTGTTQENKDGWTIGFTPRLAVGVWSGNNNRAPMQKISEAMAGPIWRAFMLQALPKLNEPMINLPGENSTTTAATTTTGGTVTIPAPAHLYNTTTGELIY
ncbi:MAG: PBP1A family penicillin-binding protein [Candidatus Paceibacterota bacterium]|jgi:1A family penicillin-binding protein